MSQPRKTEITPSDRSKAVIYARVSSKEQEKEGFSIPSQLKLLRDYAAAQRFDIVRDYVDVETAKQSGRTNFGEMIRYLRVHADVRVALVEKTDRLYRNLKDWVTVDDLDIEIHLVKEGLTLSRDSRSSEKFVHGIKVLMAKNYIDNLSEEARKGMTEKAEQGIWPTKAPLGYLNVLGPEGKKIIVPDPKRAEMVADIFEWYATGLRSLKDVSEKARSLGLIYRRTGAAVPTSTIHMMLRNRLYYGEFEWNGRIYKGRHQALIPRPLWERVQNVLNNRQAKKPRKTKWDFAFSGLITCGHCGCALVGEIKKGRYVYYHCTGFKGKCGEPYVREEVIEKEFSDLLRSMKFDQEVTPSIIRALRESHADEQREHDDAITRLQAENERLSKRIHTMYIDKLDGKVEAEFYDRMSREWLDQRDRSLREIERHQSADRSYLEEGVRLLELSQAAPKLFEGQPPREKRRLLNFLLSNSSWKDGKLLATFRQPFDLIVETATLAAATPGTEVSKPAEHPVWLGD